MTNNTFTPTDIARLARSMRTANFDPNKGRSTRRSKKTKHNNR